MRGLVDARGSVHKGIQEGVQKRSASKGRRIGFWNRHKGTCRRAHASGLVLAVRKDNGSNSLDEDGCEIWCPPFCRRCDAPDADERWLEYAPSSPQQQPAPERRPCRHVRGQKTKGGNDVTQNRTIDKAPHHSLLDRYWGGLVCLFFLPPICPRILK